MRRPSQAFVTALRLAAAWAVARPELTRAEIGTEPAAHSDPAPVVVEAAVAPSAQAVPVPLDAQPASAAESTAPVVVAASGDDRRIAVPPSEASPTPHPAAPAPAPADDDATAQADKALSSGLALGTGVGSDNVFLGGHVAYYAQFPSPALRVVAHAGGGVLYDDSGSFLGGARGGLYFAYGLRHRLVLGIYGGTLDARSYALHGVVIGQRRENGVGLSAGWEWMHETGLYVRASVGPAIAFVPDTGLLRKSQRLLWQGNFFAVGYKLW